MRRVVLWISVVAIVVSGLVASSLRGSSDESFLLSLKPTTVKGATAEITVKTFDYPLARKGEILRALEERFRNRDDLTVVHDNPQDSDRTRWYTRSDAWSVSASHEYLASSSGDTKLLRVELTRNSTWIEVALLRVGL